MTEQLILWGITLLAIAVTWWRSRHLIAPLLADGPAAGRRGDPGVRLAGVLAAVGLHRKLLRKPLSGVLHAMIFTSFLVLSTAIIQAFGSGLFPGFSLAPVGGNTWIALLQDIFALVMVAGVALATWHRHVMRPTRFRGSNSRDATTIYFLILAIVVSMLLESAFAVLEGADPRWRPISAAIAQGVAQLDMNAFLGERFFYWVHVCAILGFLVYIPGSKHRHMFLAAPNIWFRNLGSRGRSPDQREDKDVPGVQEFTEFDWKQKFDLLACTECGRCQEVCPAHAAGLPLSPKLLITDLRDAMTDPERVHEPIVGGAIAPETLWSCTTCSACQEVCPVEIEHLPKIINLRRTLVEDGTVNAGMQDAFMNLTNTGNSMGRPGRQRARWTKPLSFKPKDARKEPVDVLWFVGDYASFDPRAQETTRRVAELLKAAGVDFGILYDAEHNSGNDVRRSGEEGLFEMLAQANIEAIDAANFNRIITTDPHSLNALRNEYGVFGTRYNVQHYTTFLAELLEAGCLNAAHGLAGGKATYHDPCYLGRYNGEFDAPRRLIAAAGFELHDMPRCRENSFCCGAGGGRIWQDDEGVTERPSENRIREAMDLPDVTTFVTSCPKDKVMYTAAVDALGVGDRIEVRDVIELFEVADGSIDTSAPKHAQAVTPAQDGNTQAERLAPEEENI